MKILEIRENTTSIRSPIRNAFIDFSQMAISVVALITDAVRAGEGCRLAVDVNGRFDLDTAKAYARAIEPYPAVFRPYGGFADDIPIKDGTTQAHETPGVGVELKREMFAELRRLLGT